MSHRKSLTMPLAIAVAVLSFGFMAASQDGAAKPVKPTVAKQAGGGSDSSGAKLVLLNISEIRRAEIKKPDGDSFMFSNDKPGLNLRFAVNLQGKKVLQVEQPTTVTAADASGTDLSKIEPGFMDEMEFVTLETSWNTSGDEEDAPPSEVTFHLAPAARAAATFNLKTTFNASIYSGIESRDVTLTAKAAEVPGIMPDAKVKARIVASDDNPAIEFKPADVRDIIEKVEVLQGDEVIENQGWFSDGETVSFMFSQNFGDEATIRLTVRTGVETIPLTIDLNDQPLP